MISRFFFLISLCAFLAAGCQSIPEGIQSSRLAVLEEIKKEPPGDYFVGRRYYKEDYKFWGYIRKPGEPWSGARLVMLNEQQKLAPDREAGNIGSDRNYEYRLFGRFSGQTIYEPASNGFYPEFILTGYEIKSITPLPIFRTPAATDPGRRIIARPQ